MLRWFVRPLASVASNVPITVRLGPGMLHGRRSGLLHGLWGWAVFRPWGLLRHRLVLLVVVLPVLRLLHRPLHRSRA